MALSTVYWRQSFRDGRLSTMKKGVFKRELISDVRIYPVSNLTEGQICHAQLRTSCSYVNQHLFFSKL